MKQLVTSLLLAAILTLVQQAASIRENDYSDGASDFTKLQNIETIVSIGQKALEIMERSGTNSEEGLMVRLRNSLGKLSELSKQIEESYYALNYSPTDSRFDFCVNITFSIAKAESMLLDVTRLAEHIEATVHRFAESAKQNCNMPGIIRKAICFLNLVDSFNPDYQAHKRELVVILEKYEVIVEELKTNIRKCFYDV
ncbi:unnamed protein product [Bemisia tabaci]|uniref:Uncharacterized protein n=1 Tax=Bemisia tabaci TaxID=7038 RepID=A0A9P0F4Q4_BEMTA|nr:unnamed protein product [Bemisia tabaci]